MFFLVAYDITSPKRLNKIARIMKNYGDRKQKSVFECDISECLFIEMKQKIDKILDFNTDTVRFYFLCEKCRQRIEISGTGSLTVKEDIIII